MKRAECSTVWVTGSNIAIIGGLLMLAGIKAVGKRRAVWIAIGGILLYTLLVGADAAVVRAAIMGGLFVLALYLGRYAEPGIPVLRTDELGTVEFVTDGERLWVEAGR